MWQIVVKYANRYFLVQCRNLVAMHGYQQIDIGGPIAIAK